MSDWKTTDDGDLDEFGRDTDTDEEDLQADTLHWLSTPYGSNPDDRNRGVGSESFLSGTPDLNGLERAIALDLRKDSRIGPGGVGDITVAVQDGGQNGDVYDVDVVINEGITVSTTLSTVAGGGKS